MKKIFQLVALLASLSVPIMAAAQTGVNVSYLQNYSNSITGVINYILVPVLMAIAFIVFLFGVYRYFIQGAASDTERAAGRQFTLWGVIGFVVILSLWGIVNIFMSTLGLSVGKAPAYPTIGNVGGSQNTTGGSVFGNTGGTPGSSVPGFPGTSVYGTSAQNTALLQQYNAKQSVCGISSTSADCQAAEAAYTASYYAVNPNPNATTQNAQNTTVGAGADCTYSPCSSGLTCNYDSTRGYSVCEGSVGTDSYVQACIAKGISAAQCQCEANGGTNCDASGTTSAGLGSYCLTATDQEGTVDANGNCVAN